MKKSDPERLFGVVYHETLQSLLRQVEAIDLTAADEPLKRFAHAWLDMNFPGPIPEESAQVFQSLSLQRLRETCAPTLTQAIQIALTGAINYANRAIGSTVMPRTESEPPSPGQAPETDLLSLAESIRIQGVIRVTLNEEEVIRRIREIYEEGRISFSVAEEPGRAWGRLLAKDRKHLKRRMGDEPVKKAIAAVDAVESMSDEERRLLADNFARSVSQSFFQNIDHTVRCAIAANLLLSVVYGEYLLEIEQGKDEEKARRSLPGVEELKDVVIRLLSHLLVYPLPTKPHPGRTPAADEMDLLQGEYERLVVDWTDASALCKARRNARSLAVRDTWRREIKQCYPDFPDDLIELLPPKHDWENVREEFHKRRNVTSKPEDIALLHAARICGDKDNKLTLPTLKKYLQQQRNGTWKK